MERIIMNQSIIKNTVNSLQNLQFDVVAVPQKSNSQIFDVRSGAIVKPVNIKIRVRNKEEIKKGHEVISVLKLSTSCPRKVRLVSSDQTIISFDLLMGSENVKKVPKKNHSKFLQLFKASGCFNNQNDDDNYPYVPSSPNNSYRTRSVADVHDLYDDKIIDEKFTLKKNLPPVSSTNNTLRTPTFFGKCKPGGCLDPPFDEDKYIYKHKLLEIDQKYANKKESTDEKLIEDNIVSGKRNHESGSITECKSSNSSVKEIYHHVITYPPVLSPSELYVHEQTQSKESNLSTSSDKKVRKSFNEFTDTYFMPTRRKKSKIDIQPSTEIQKNPSVSYNSNNTNTDIHSSKQEELSQLLSSSNQEVFNQDLETKILLSNVEDTNIVSEKEESSKIIPLKDINSKLFDTNIQMTQESSLTEATANILNLNDDKLKEDRLSISVCEIKSEGTENLELNTMIDTITVFESNIESPKVSPFIIKDTIKNEHVSKITSQVFKEEKNEENNKLITHVNLMDNQLLVSQKLSETVSTVENGTLQYNISKTDESKTEHLTPSDNGTLTSSNTVLTEYLEKTENVPQETNMRTSKLYHNIGESIEHKESATIPHLQASLINQIKDIELTDQLHFEEMKKSEAQQVNTKIINNLKIKYTNDIHEIKTKNDDYEDNHHKPNNSTVENEAQKRHNLTNTDENISDLKPFTPSSSVSLTSTTSVFPEHLLKTEVFPRATYTKPLKIYKRISESIEHNEAVTIARSQASLVEQTQVIGQKNVEKIKTSESPVDTTTHEFEEKIVNDLQETENANSIECDDDNDKSFLSTVEKEPLTYNLSSTDGNELKLRPLTQFDNTLLISTNTSLNTTGNKYEEKIYTSDLPGIKTEKNMEYRNNKDDHQKSITSSSGVIIVKSDLSMKSANLTMNIPNILDSNGISKEKITKAILQVGSTLLMSDKETVNESFVNNEDSLAISQSLSLPTSMELLPALVLEEKKSAASQIQEKYTFNEEPVYYEHRKSLASSRLLNLSSLIDVPNRSKQVQPSGHLPVHSHEDEKSLNSTISFKSQSFKEDTGDVHLSSSSNFFPPKLHETLDNVMLETIARLQLKTSKVISIISDTEKARQSADDFVDTTEENLNSQPKVFLGKSNPDVKPIKLNIPTEHLENLRAVFSNENQNEFMTINESEEDKNLNKNKKSSIKIDFGFHFFVDDKNETLIKTFDTNKHLEFGPLDKITVMKSTIRGNDSEIRIPVTSKTDITLQIKKPFIEDNNAKKDIDNGELTKQVPGKSSSKTILLKETLDSVYENLVTIQNIIRNLKQEAEFLTQEQVLFREILNELNNKSVKITNANRKCNCNKL